MEPASLKHVLTHRDGAFFTNRAHFIERFKPAITTRETGLSWPNAANTWQAATAYFKAILESNTTTTIRRLSRSMKIPEDRLQQFITDSPWDHDAVQMYLNEDIPPEFQSVEAILYVDGMPILKTGKKSVGVAKQWAGNVGKVATSQHAVDLTLILPDEDVNANHLTWPLGMKLYLPKKWLETPEYAPHREDVRLPDDIEFRTKPEIALELIERARDTSVPHSCLGADAEFGDSRPFRGQLRDWNEPYIPGVTPSELRVIPEDTPLEHPEDYQGPGPCPTVSRYPEDVTATSPKELAAGLEEDDWIAVTWSHGSQGDLSARVARRRIRVVSDTQRRAVTEETGWLLLEDRDGETKAWLCWGVDEWSLEKLVRYAHQQAAVEQFHRESKQFLGMNEFEGRTWAGWHHHVTMVVLAYAFLALERARVGDDQSARGGADERLPPLSKVAEAVQRETCIQELMEERGLDRSVAEEATSTLLRKLFGTPESP